MRKAAYAGLFAFATVVVASSSSVSAQALDLLQTDEFEDGRARPVVLASLEEPALETQPAAQPAKPEPTVHKIKPAETLSLIAEQHGTTWKRLYDKNTKLDHPDVITVGQEIIVPFPDEELKERPLPPRVQLPLPETSADAPPRAARPRGSSQVRSVTRRGSSAGNTYTAGYCTWYVKNRRPDLPNNLGNANTWVSRARAQGIPTGSRPRVGAVGQRGMHVVYVERVNSNGTVTVSEMNYRGLFVTSTRTVPAGYFHYIY